VDRVLTIGVYGWSPERWVAALHDARCDLVVDIRARRGVRGPEHAFANSKRLQAIVAEAGLRYAHLPVLAPSRATRDAQVAADAASKTAKRDRALLGDAFVAAYQAEVVDAVDWQPIIAELTGATPALLCVERLPAACHRSIVADELAQRAGCPVVDLVP
jgi:uncharacterized protein (DUF488 family)